ncbi:hypothetical protein ABVK25_000812 [Lepraria finkii]|uniref:Uncharacterized protein n=1 Tax=Lepraria finkii TaxID=1340010 RepID=A0ABR4BNZ2_9LECA
MAKALISPHLVCCHPSTAMLSSSNVHAFRRPHSEGTIPHSCACIFIDTTFWDVASATMLPLKLPSIMLIRDFLYYIQISSVSDPVLIRLVSLSPRQSLTKTAIASIASPLP